MRRNIWQRKGRRLLQHHFVHNRQNTFVHCIPSRIIYHEDKDAAQVVYGADDGLVTFTDCYESDVPTIGVPGSHLSVLDNLGEYVASIFSVLDNLGEYVASILGVGTTNANLQVFLRLCEDRLAISR